jgi:hypothetical protein
MGEDKRNPTTGEDDKSALDSVEEALVGSHQEPPSDGSGGGREPEIPDEDGPPVPGNQTP